MHRLILPLLGLLLVLLVAGCSPVPAAPGAAKEPEKVTIRFGTLYILDAVPAHVAVKEGLFEKENLKVEIIPFNSAVERDTAMQTGQIDAGLNDLPSGILLNKDGEKAKIVRVALRTTPDRAMFTILASPKSTINSPNDLKNKDIAISFNSVIEYVADQLLKEKGFKSEEIKKIDVAAMPLRMQMLSEGQVPAALLPEPLATMARNLGARPILDDKGKAVGQSVILFSQKMVNEKPDAVRRFLTAYEKAVDAFNKDPEKYRALMIEAGRVPEALKNTLTPPIYPKASVPSADEVANVNQWFVAKGILKEPLSYSQVVNGSFLPK